MNNCIKIAVAFLVSAVFAGSLEASAESREHRADTRHEFRLGWGDQMFEKLIWQKPPYIISNLNESYRKTYKENWRYSQHWFAEYSYRVNGWFGVGAMVDASGCVWDDVTRNGLGVETDRHKGLNFWNLTLMPMCRFIAQRDARRIIPIRRASFCVLYCDAADPDSPLIPRRLLPYPAPAAVRGWQDPEWVFR